MGKRYFLLCLCLFVLNFIQTGDCDDGSSDLPSWLYGIIAVCVFLIFAFIFIVVNYYFCGNLYAEDKFCDDELETLGFKNQIHEDKYCSLGEDQRTKSEGTGFHTTKAERPEAISEKIIIFSNPEAHETALEGEITATTL